MNELSYRRIYTILCFLRVVCAFTIFANPLFALTSSIILDSLDGVNASRGGLRKDQYHLIDKTLDLIWYTISLVFILSSNEFYQFKALLLTLYFIRILGIFFYSFTKKRTFLFYFANYYENILIIVLLGTLVAPLSFLLVEPNFLVAGIIAAVIKMLQEYVLHYSEYSFTENILKIKMRWKE